MCNKVFSLNFGMGNPNSSTFLCNVQWKVVKQLKNSDFHSIFHNETVTVNLFVILEILPEIYLTMCNKVFSLNFCMENPNSSTFSCNVQYKIIKQLKNSDFHSIYIMQLSLSICLKF